MQTVYLKTNRQVRVRQTPSLAGAEVRWLDADTIVESQTSSRTEADGYVWWQHKDGWSAAASLDGRWVFMDEVDAPASTTPTTTTTTTSTPTTTSTTTTTTSTTTASAPAPVPVTPVYLKANQQVRVRTQPALTGSQVRWLDADEVVESKSSSRTEADGYIWWQHKDGWSAEKSTDGQMVFMSQVDKPSATTSTATAPTTTTTTTTTTAPAPVVSTSDVLKLQAKIDVRVRTQADLSGTFIKWIPAGTVLELNKSSETVNDGYVWYHHKEGWSASKSVDGRNVFLVEPGSVENVATMTANGPDVNTLPELKTLIKRMPVDLNSTDWFQYFGNNVYAYNNGKSWGYDRYAQGLHSGLDFGNNSSYIPTYAGVDATFVKEDRYGIFLKTGSYTLIYQHLTNTTRFTAGQAVSVNTKLGELDPSSYRLRHLHFEIRYKGAWIVNPLLFMSDAMVNQITSKFNPSNPIYFYKSGSWNQWQTPMDQPVIKLGGPVIGPTAG